MKVATLSTESIASSPSAVLAVAESCAVCGAPLASDQRYCLECGERRALIGNVLLGGRPQASGVDHQPSRPVEAPFIPRDAQASTGAAQRGNTVTVIAGIGVLLLAMGVGVLIGRAANSKPASTPAQVISVAQPGATTGGVPIPTTPTTATPEAPAQGGSSSAKPGATKKGATGTGAGATKGGGSAGKPPAATPKSSSHSSGKSFEEKSKNLPNVVETG
jgi:hypothetical protein